MREPLAGTSNLLLRIQSDEMFKLSKRSRILPTGCGLRFGQEGCNEIRVDFVFVNSRAKQLLEFCYQFW